MKKITILLVLAALFVACENESINDEIFNEDNNTPDTEETTDGEEIILGDQ